MALQANPKSITMGSGTDGSDGDMSVIFLPGGVSAYFTGIGVYYPNGELTQRKGVRIDHYIKPQTIDKFYYNPYRIIQHILSELDHSLTHKFGTVSENNSLHRNFRSSSSIPR